MKSGAHFVPATIAAWLVAGLCGGHEQLIGWWWAVSTGLLLIGALVLAYPAWAPRGVGGVSRIPGRWTWPIATALAVGCAVAMTSAWQTQEFHQQPWATWTAQRSHIQAAVTVTSPARMVSVPQMWTGTSDQQRATAVVDIAQSPGEASWELGSRVLVSGPVDGDTGLWTVGEVIVGDFRVSPGDARAGTLARLNLMGTPTRTGPASGWTQAVRHRFESALARVGGDRAALVQGMTTGDDSGLSSAATTTMRAAGLSHLTAVSGANLAIVTGAVFWLARRARMSHRGAVIPAATAMFAYVGVTGLEPSVLRASVMAGVALLGVVLGGGRAVVGLQLSIVGLLIADPRLAFSRGFALSCAATAGLIVLTPRLTSAWRTWSRNQLPSALRPAATALIGIAVVSLAAGVATAPLLAAYGQGVSWVSLITNTAASPLVPVITILGLLAGIVAWLSIPVGGVIGGLAAIPAGAILGIAKWGAEVPGARLPWGSGAIGAGTVLLGVALGWWAGRRWPIVRIATPVAVVGGALLVAQLPGWLVRPPPADWVFVICDVGQGDAALLRTGPRSAVVVDTGPEPDSAVACVQRNRIEVVDAVLLTHFHADHVAGVSALLGRYRPAQVLVSQFREPAETVADVMAATTTLGTALQEVRRGDVLHAGWLTWRVLAPVSELHTGSAPNNNSVAVVAEVTREGVTARAFFGGDMEAEEQTMMMSSATREGLSVDVDVVKVPHHGSANQHPRLPDWTAGEVAVMSCGTANDYGHPAPRTVAEWERVGASVVRTDMVGDVVVRARADGAIAVESRRVVRPWQPAS